MAADMPRSEAPAGDWNVSKLKSLFWQRRWLVTAICVEVFLVTGLVTFLQTPQYDASARVLIERTTPRLLTQDDMMPATWNEFEIQRFYETQYLLIREPAVLEKALDMPGIRSTLLERMAPEEMREDGQPLPTDAELAQYLAAGLTLGRMGNSKIVRITFRDPSPQFAADVVNAVVQTYKNFFVETGLDARQGVSRFLDERIEDAQAEVIELEQKLYKERDRILLAPGTKSSEIGQARLESLDSQLTQAKAHLARAEARVQAYVTTPPLGIDQVARDPQVVRYRSDLSELQRELAELDGQVGPEWPRLIELRQAISETEANLTNQLKRLYDQAVESARAERELARGNVSRLESLLGSEMRKTASSQLLAADFESLRSKYEQKKSVLDRLMQRHEEAALGADLQKIIERQVTVIAAASPPKGPSSPRVKLNLLMGLILGLSLGLAAAIFMEMLDNKIRDGAQLQDLTGLPLLGSIPRVGGTSRPRLAFSRQKSHTPVMSAQDHDVEEAFRALRSAMLLSRPDHPPRSLLVTSALPADGKSTISVNLARTLAAFGKKVVLIDADLRHPRLHRVFKVDGSKGLTNLLAAQGQKIDEVLAPTRYEGLTLLPGGPCPPDPATLLDGQRMTKLMEDLYTRHDIDFVLVDSPPVMVFADVFNLVPTVEAVILVARALQTPKEAIRSTIDALRKVAAPMVGVVLNAESQDNRTNSYYRSYHYRKGYYGKAAQEAAEAKAAKAAKAEAKQAQTKKRAM